MKRLKHLRKKMGLSQMDLQELTQIDQSNLSKFELGQRVPTVDNLVILAKFFNVNMEYLLDLTDDPTPLWRDTPKEPE